jgi:uncharacterized protein
LAAEQGSPRAQCALAVIYERGLGVTRDPAEAIRWYRKIVDEAAPPPVLGEIDWARGAADFAMTQLGFLYENGDGVAPDEAAAWFRKAAAHGYVGAQTVLGIKYVEGRGVPQDSAEAAKLLGKAANKGVTRAQIALGNLYASGQGVSQDIVQAYKWFNLAARYPASKADHDIAVKDSLRIAAQMTTQQIDEAEKLIQAWVPGAVLDD